METITEALKEQFAKNIQLNIQQEGSKLKKYVTVGTQDTEVMSFESMENHETESRNRVALDDNPMFGHYRDPDDGNELEQIKFKIPTISRRYMTCAAEFWNAVMDRNDKLNLLTDPTSHFPKMAGWAMGRKHDRVIIKAFGEPVRAGRTGNKTINFDVERHVIPTGINITDPGLTLNAQIAADENREIIRQKRAGLTVDKLIKAHHILKKRSFGMFDKLYLLCSSQQISDLLKDPQITSYDYNSVRALVSGEVNSFLGFTFIISEMLGGIYDSTGDKAKYAIRDCYAFNEGAVRFNTVNGSVKKSIEEMLQYHFAKILYYSEAFGAVRDNEKAVVAIKCLEKYDSSTHTDKEVDKHTLWEKAADADHKRGVEANIVPWQMFGAECKNVINNDVINAEALMQLGNEHVATVERPKVAVVYSKEAEAKEAVKEEGGGLFD